MSKPPRMDRFKVEIDNKSIGHFKSVDGLSWNIETSTFDGNNSKGTPMQQVAPAGPARGAELTLSTDAVTDEFLSWWKKQREKPESSSGAIVFFDDDWKEAFRLTIVDAFPKTVSWGDHSASDSSPVGLTVTLAAHSLDVP